MAEYEDKEEFEERVKELKIKETNKNFHTTQALFIKPDELHTKQLLEGQIVTEVDTGLNDDMYTRLKSAMNEICKNAGMVTDEQQS